MQIKNSSQQLSNLIKREVSADKREWLDHKINKIIEEKSSKELYLTYSLLASKIDKTTLQSQGESSELTRYLTLHQASILEIARIYLLTQILEADPDFFNSKVANIIQIADKSELATFLKYLILLPNPESFKSTAVDSLRTNIASVFDALALNNPYPGQFFNDQQWNQMFLKAAFMQRDLTQISDIDKRANKDLARIISDYAHERWAASRDIDPFFWRPVTNFLDKTLLEDMKRLLESQNPLENKVAAILCYNSENEEAQQLLKKHPSIWEEAKLNNLNWNTLKK